MRNVAIIVVIACGIVPALSAPPDLAAGYMFFSPGIISNLQCRRMKDTAAGDFFTAVFRLANDSKNKKPAAQTMLRIEGHLGSEDARIVNDDMLAINAFGLDHQLNRDNSSREHAERYLLAWARTYLPTGNPIDEEYFLKYAGGYDLVRHSIDTENKAVIEEFLRLLFETGKAFIAAKKGFIPNGNFDSRHLALSAAIAFCLDDAVMKRYCENTYRRLIDHNILPGGTVRELFPEALSDLHVRRRADEVVPRGATIDFVQRDAMEYHCASAAGLLTAVLIARRHRLDWGDMKAANGQTIFDALDFTIPYAAGRKTHAEFARSLAAFDAEHHRGGMFDAARARQLLAMAAVLSARYRDFADPSVLPPFERLLYYGFSDAP
ncbi:MAG: alginate lyase family protein [Spirochaetota bacterium]